MYIYMLMVSMHVAHVDGYVAYTVVAATPPPRPPLLLFLPLADGAISMLLLLSLSFNTTTSNTQRNIH